jgi:hypothetical protein
MLFQEKNKKKLRNIIIPQCQILRPTCGMYKYLTIMTTTTKKKKKRRWTRVLTYLAISRVMLERINHPLKIVYLMIEKI